MKLVNVSQNKEICPHVEVADSFLKRAVGLIGTRNFENRALFFPGERWPHTFFMSIPIDVVYLNDSMNIVKITHELRPWRVTLPVFAASNLIEFAAGFAKGKDLHIGDQLHVGH